MHDRGKSAHEPSRHEKDTRCKDLSMMANRSNSVTRVKKMTVVMRRPSNVGGRARAGFMASMGAVLALSLVTACASPEEKAVRYAEEGQELLDAGDSTRAYLQFQNALKQNEEYLPALRGLALIAEERQDFSTMFGVLQQIVRLDPAAIDAYVKLGKLYLISSDEITALEQAEKALTLDAEYIDALSLKSGILLKIGDNAGAVEMANGILARDRANAEANTVIATDLSLNRDFEGALEQLDGALAINPQIAMLQLLRIHLLETLGRQDDVLDAYAEIIRLFPDQPAYRRVYSNELIKRGDLDEAKTQLQQIVELEPESLSAKMNVIRVVKSADGDAAGEAALRGYIAEDTDNTELQFALIDYLIGTSNTDAAKAELSVLADDKDQDVALQAKNRIAAILLQEGERERSVELINEILDADERNTDALTKRAALQIENEEFDQAIINLRTALDNSPDRSDAMVLMSSAFEQQSNYSFAQAELAKAFETSKRDPKVAAQFARFLMRRDNNSRAEEVLEESLADHPDSAETLKMLASIRLAKQDWRGAEQAASALEAIGDDDVLVANIKSAAYIGLQDYDRVIDTLSEQNQEQTLTNRPLNALVAAYLREDRAQEAQDLLQRILSTDPDNYVARIQLARVYASRQDSRQFEATLIEATERRPDRDEAYELLYRRYLSEGRQADASELIERGLRASPDSQAMRVFKADVLLSRGDLEGALALYSDLITERPDDRIIANNFVSLSSDLRTDPQSIARAMEVAKTIEELENPFYRDTVGWAYYRTGDYARAVELLSEAVAGASDNADMLYHLGAAQLAAGDAAAGRENLEKALSVGGAAFAFEDEVRALLD